MRTSQLLILLFICGVFRTAHAHPELEDRLQQLDALVDANPDQRAVYILRAREYSRAGQWELAQQEFTKAKTLGTGEFLLFEMGLHFYRKGDYVEAQAQFSHLLEWQPKNTMALLYNARAAAKLGQSQRAASAYLAFFSEKKSAHPGDYLSAAKLLSSQGRDGIERALVLLDQGILTLGNGPHLQRFAVELEQRLGRNKKAIQRWYSLQPSLGNNPSWKVELAELYRSENELKKARQLLNAADSQLLTMKITPSRKRLHDTIQNLRRDYVARDTL